VQITVQEAVDEAPFPAEGVAQYGLRPHHGVSPPRTAHRGAARHGGSQGHGRRGRAAQQSAAIWNNVAEISQGEISVMPAMNISSKTRSFLTLLCVLLLGGLCFAQSPVTLKPTWGPPTTNLSVSGSHFPALTLVDIYFDTTEVALAVTNISGVFSGLEIEVPASALPGTHWVTAVVSTTGQAGQSPFYVQTSWAEFHATNKHTGLNPYENILSPSTAGNLDLNWSYTTGGQGISSPSSAAVFSPSGHEVYVAFIGSEDDNVYALNTSTGGVLWKYTTGGQVFSSPAAGNGSVYVGSDDFSVYALNVYTGALLWKYGTGSYVWSSPTVASEIVNGVLTEVVYVGSNDSNIYALNATTGALLWKYATGNFVQSSPAVVNGVVYVSSEDDNVYALNATTGELLWEYATGSWLTSSPAVADGVVYVGSSDSNVYALKASTGALLWKYTTGSIVTSSPAVADGVVYVGSDDDNLYALDAYGGYLHWNYATGGPVESSPAVANGVVYVGSNDGNVYAIDVEGGYKLWQYTTGNAVSSSPAVANGVVYVGSTDSNVYAFSDIYDPVQAIKRPDPAKLRPTLR
jgi:outer membrane protein assembly factor BamB